MTYHECRNLNCIIVFVGMNEGDRRFEYALLSIITFFREWMASKANDDRLATVIVRSLIHDRFVLFPCTETGLSVIPKYARANLIC